MLEAILLCPRDDKLMVLPAAQLNAMQAMSSTRSATAWLSRRATVLSACHSLKRCVWE
jgi:hypothetical protein